MKAAAAWLQAFALEIGGPGLFIIAFLDSSFLSLPEINDLLVVWMVTRHKDRMVFYASMATLGSLTGCLLLYAIGRKGGEAVLRRRFRQGQIDRALALYRRYGVLAIVVPSLLPPPAPFKVFVLMGGVARLPVTQFSLAVVFGRGLRYFAEGWLALHYGDVAIEYVRTHGVRVSLWLAGLALAAGVVYFLVRRRRGGAGS